MMMKRISILIRKVSDFILIFFPVMLVGGQVIVNLLYFYKPEWYYGSAFWLNFSLGTNGFFALFLLILTHRLRMCGVSKWAAYAEVLFALNYAIVQKDNLYNILFQVIVGVVFLIFCFNKISKKYPLCSFGLFWRFLGDVIKTCSCSKGFEIYKRHNDIYNYKKYHRDNPTNRNIVKHK